MADQKTKWFKYEGPPVFIVALQTTVENGWKGEGPAELEASAGFTAISKPKSAD